MVKPDADRSIPPAEARQRRLLGLYSSLLAAFLLGWAPILGKLAYQADVDPLTLASLRTVIACAFLWAVYLIFWPGRVPIPWKAMLGCLIVGAVNGVGSLFYYSGLARLEASRAALLGSLHPMWVVAFLSAAGQAVRRATLVQLISTMIGAILVTAPWVALSLTDSLGVMLMVASSAVNGWYLVMGQWILADVPSRSGALYILTGMAITVSFARLVTLPGVEAGVVVSASGWGAILALAITTALNRMATFYSLENLGGIQTALLSVTELAVSLALAFVFLGDRMAWYQWLGAAFLLVGTVLARFDAERNAPSALAFDPLEVAR